MRERRGTHLCIQPSRGVVLAHALGKVPLHASELLVAVRRKVRLYPDLRSGVSARRSS